jgi:hypothetical protein
VMSRAFSALSHDAVETRRPQQSGGLRKTEALWTHFLGVVTERRRRPLRRRRFRTDGPDLERIRTRNPWVRRRGVLCGW